MNAATSAPRGRRTGRWRLAAPLAVAVVASALAACGSDGSSGTTSGSDQSTASNVAAAKKAVAPYVGHPSAFPVSEPLTKLPGHATVAYANCGTPVCALMYQLLQPATSTIGFTPKQFKTGPDAQALKTGMDSIVASKPNGVIAVAADFDLWQRQLKQLQDQKIPVATTGISGAKAAGIKAAMSSDAQNLRAGKLLADYVVAEMDPKANVAIYRVPELSFTGQVVGKFVEEMKSICPACSVRTVDVPVATLGNTAPTTVVSDLQAHPDTDVAVFSIDEISLGLPAALKTAGIKVQTLGYAPGPQNLQYIKDGQETAGLAFDLPVAVWSLVDMLAREMVGQPLSGPESEGYTVNQFLRKEDITFDPSKGWTGYPDFAERFKKLWGVNGGAGSAR